MSSESVHGKWEDLIYSSFISIKNLSNNNSAFVKLVETLIFICALSDNLRLEIVKSGVSLIIAFNFKGIKIIKLSKYLFSRVLELLCLNLKMTRT